jgi:hypothetical protein
VALVLFILPATLAYDLTHPNRDAASAAGGYDAFVTEQTRSGATLYSTYLGGSGTDQASGIAVDGAGDAYVTGQTDSADYPTTVPTLQVTTLV